MASELYEKYKDLADTQISDEEYLLMVISAAGFFPWSMNRFQLTKLGSAIFSDPVVKSRVVDIFFPELGYDIEDPSTLDVIQAMTDRERQALRARVLSK